MLNKSWDRNQELPVFGKLQEEVTLILIKELKMDADYVKEKSVLNDIAIILKTPWAMTFWKGGLVKMKKDTCFF